MTRRAVVVGRPIGHSRSPAIFRHWFARYGIIGEYGKLDIAPERFEKEIRRLAAEGFAGVNVTVPHKEAAAGIADERSETTRRIGAANILTFRDGGIIHADSSDGFGFIESLRAQAPGWNPQAGHAVVMGAGGSACAIVDALKHAGVPGIRIVNRTLARAEGLVERLGGALAAFPLDGAAHAVHDAALVVNATTLGMEGQPPLPVSVERARVDAVVADIVYVPRETRLLREARRTGRTAVHGTGMLLHQARPAFECWYGRKPEVDAALEADVFGSVPWSS